MKTRVSRHSLLCIDTRSHSPGMFSRFPWSHNRIPHHAEGCSRISVHPGSGLRMPCVHWGSFIASLKERCLQGVQIFISDLCMRLVESLAEYYPEAAWQRCTVHFYRNVFTNVAFNEGQRRCCDVQGYSRTVRPRGSLGEILAHYREAQSDETFDRCKDHRRLCL